jgi:hypothetical protein
VKKKTKVEKSEKTKTLSEGHKTIAYKKTKKI